MDTNRKICYSAKYETPWNAPEFGKAQASSHSFVAIRQDVPLGRFETANGTVLLAEVLEKQGRHWEAESYYKSALAVQEISLGGNHPVAANTLEK